MLTDRFYPSSYPNNYPPKYKPPKSLINNNQIVSSTINRYGNLLVSNQHQQQLTIDTNLKEESSYRLIDYLTWTIYFSSAISVISLIAITPNYVIEAVAIKEGRIIIADEFVAEENQKQEEIDYESIRLTGAIRSAIVTLLLDLCPLCPFTASPCGHYTGHLLDILGLV
ncbi:uncharacterized protein LOC128390661 [Panonychus citri]|uniref:uncharacterized protein LOC128390661 n=1 Tax=Panonychus citri TaxID=50023 RepID=UPI0023075930|nr:uncharacterized protein LOC128390661 [Panonychus citri]